MGAKFRSAVTVAAPPSNVDLMSTILASLSLTVGKEIDDRVLTEAFRVGPDPLKVAYETKLAKVTDLVTQQYFNTQTLGDKRYIDKSWRVK